MRQLFLVYQRHGGPWDWSRAMREQSGFDEHAQFMDALVADGFVVLGRPIDEGEVLLVVECESEAEIRRRLATDPWLQSGMLAITAVRPWTVLLEGRLGGSVEDAGARGSTEGTSRAGP